MERAIAGVLAALAFMASGSGPSGDVTRASRPPVVLVVFDALPIQLLQDGSGHIDAERFPNFAAFAGQGTWYRNATTISESTRFSVPALLDGRRPRPGAREDYDGHPVNIFTLLRKQYRMNVREEATALCPPSLCGVRVRPSVIELMRNGRSARFRRSLARLSPGRRPQLTFIHTLLPHEPRQYLPDGRRYALGNAPDALAGTPSMNRRFLTEQVEQRTIIQLQFADRLLGELIAKLKREGTWESSLVAIVSDHGESFAVKHGAVPPFRIGELSFRRAASRHNLQDIAGIAMFVKYPRQQRGRIDDRFVRHTDLLPTILRAARIRAPRGLMGDVLTNRRYRGHREIAVFKQDGRIVAMPATRWRKRVAASKRHELALFGSGKKSLYDFGPAPELHGRPVSELELEPQSKLRATVATARLLAHVRLRANFLPAQAYGALRGGRAAGRRLLFALNGTVVASAPSFSPLGKLNWSAMLPPEAFREGANKLEVFEWLGGRRARRLYG